MAETMAADKKPPPETIRNKLDRIFQNPDFKASPKQREFLEFVVSETLAGRASQIKGYTIAVTVFGRKEAFDPQADPVVRLEAGRLRRALENYYMASGKNDPVRIEIPKGGYVPTFRSGVTLSSKANTLITEPESSGLANEPSIAVLPLLNLSGDAEQDYFTDGIVEELTSELARYEEFNVIASQSTLRFKGENVEPQKIGRDLGVRFLLTGSLRMGSDNIKVMVRLLDAHTTGQIWGESYKRDLKASDLIELQESIARRVTGAIADQYGSISRRLSREAGKGTPESFQAYDAVLRFYHYETILTPEAFKDALSALERAVELEPEYGLAWAMLGHLHADNYALGFCEMDAPLEKALRFAQKGVSLAPENQFVHDALSLIYFHRGDKALFLKHVEETLALNPHAPYIVGVAGWHMALFGEWERGLDLLKKGIKLNPYHPSWFHLVSFMDHYRRGEYENAFAEALKFNYPELFWDPLMRAAALGRMGRKQEAKDAIGELSRLMPEFESRARQSIGFYVKVDELVDKIIEGLQKAGMDNLV